MAARKALFSKPAWAAKPTGPVEVDQPIFQQNVYEDILQERRRKEERRLQKQKEKEEKAQRERNSESRETRVDEERTVKKRRISNNRASVGLEDDSENDAAVDEETSDSDSGLKSGSEKHVHSKPTRQSKSPASLKRATNSSRRAPHKTDDKRKSPNGPSPNIASDPILVEDDDDEVVITDIVPTPKPPPQTKPKSKPKPPPPPELQSESEEEDEYIKELKRKARKEAQEKNRQAATANTNLNNGASLNTARASSIEESNNSSAPTVQILINTIIPNCPPVIIKRRPSQTLESVHTYFCQQNNLNENLRDKVFFTWNNQRLFKSTTTRSILDQIKRKHGRDDSKGNIELEAVTDVIYEHRLRQKEESRRRAENDEESEEQGESSFNTQPNGQINPSGTSLIDPTTGAIMGGAGTNQDQSTSIAAAGGGGGAPPKSPGIVIKLTPEDASVLKPLSLRVHAHTTIERIVRGYKSRTEVEPAKEIYLVFEGDRLEGSMRVDQAGFEDGDSVDVRSK